ncbi:MAG: non-hydrolyzing UDP-N-acetylglucosamine 2-epimerase [Candidatus Hodarchaeota archaeon]
MKILVFIGTRPEIIKMEPIVKVLDASEHECLLAQSGQHIDFEMTSVFFNDLNLRTPDFKFEIGSGSHSEQTASMLKLCEKLFQKIKPDLILAEGDTNTVVGAGLSAAKLHVPFGHVEAGLRSFDLLMPEEVNRRIADMCAVVNFAPSERAVLNLLYEGIPPSRVFITGNTVVDVVVRHSKNISMMNETLQSLNLSRKVPFILLTLHRPKNVDNLDSLKNLLNVISRINETIVFPAHPRTRQSLIKHNLLDCLNSAENLILIDPLSYFNFLAMLKHATLVMTDSGGVQEEALTLKTPCVTLRKNTERPETVEAGVNFLTGSDPDQIVNVVNYVLENNKLIHQRLEGIKNPYGDGKAAEKILTAINYLGNRSLLEYESSCFLSEGSPTKQFKLIKIEKETSVANLQDETGGVISLLYDEEGNPIFPTLDTSIKANWTVRLTFSH